MNTSHLKTLGLVAVVGAALAVLNVANAKDVPGKEVTVKVTDGAGQDWRHLQRLQIHLRQELPGERLEIDCATNIPEPNQYGGKDDGVTCGELAGAQRVSEVQDLRRVVKLVYSVTKKYWDDNDMERAFKEATITANKEEADNTPGGIPPAVLDYDPVDVTWSAGPLCEGYASPCYVRPNCGGTGKCSKVSTGCVQCTYP
jgi:hypothetical protein